MAGKSTITTADVARKAGLSKMTVSRVLNDYPYVSEKTRQRVLGIVRELGFTPNTLAKRFFTGKTRLVGLIMPFQHMFSSFYFKDLFRGVHDALEERDYDLLLHDSTSRKRPPLEKACDLVKGRLVEGLLIAAPMSSDDYPQRLTQEGVPFVVLGETTRGSEVHRVGLRNRAASQDAVRRLVEAGHRRIAVMTFGGDHLEGTQRLKGYRDALKAAGIPFDAGLVGIAHYQRRAAYDETLRLMARNPGITAFFATNADMAMGVSDAVVSLGLRIPDSVSLVGFDDCPELEVWQPPLSTVRQDPHRVGLLATQLLLDIVGGKSFAAPQQIMTETSFVNRASVSPPRKPGKA